MKNSSNKVRVLYILMILVAIALNIKYVFIDFGVDSEFEFIQYHYRNRIVSADDWCFH